MIPKKALLAASAVFLIQSLSPAQAALSLEGLTDQEAGLAIMEASDSNNTGFINSSSDMLMTLINRKGKRSIREMRNRVLEGTDSGDKTLSVFDSPADVKGTAMLTFSHGLEDDDQWLFLPALKRVKRISSKNQSGPFMGSEFSYEDMGSLEIEKYTYKFVGEEAIDGVDCYVVERYPVSKFSGYSKQVTWMDKEHLNSQKVDYYDRKGELLKTLILSDYQLHNEKFWRSHKMVMSNHQTGKGTELEFNNFHFDTDKVRKSDFNSSALKRIR